MYCQSCGIESPTKYVEFAQNIGMFVTRLSTKAAFKLCHQCIRRYFWSYTLTTLFLGWWGLISLVVTPVILVKNIVQYWQARQLPHHDMAAMNMAAPSIPSSMTSGSFKFKVIYGLIIWTLVLFEVAVHQVTFMEKHAPGLNARLHTGEITDENDAEYVGLKVGEDLTALEADFRSNDWTGMRSELLAREPYLSDLNMQNDRLQRRIIAERNANLGASDPCEQWALNQIGPALNNYTIAINRLFNLVKSAPQISQENNSAIIVSDHQVKNARDDLHQVLFSDGKCR